MSLGFSADIDEWNLSDPQKSRKILKVRRETAVWGTFVWIAWDWKDFVSPSGGRRSWRAVYFSRRERIRGVVRRNGRIESARRVRPSSRASAGDRVYRRNRRRRQRQIGR